MADKKVTGLVNLDSTDSEVLDRFALKLFEEEKKIASLWLRGVSPRIIKLQFPTYTEEDIVAMCQAKFDITKINWQALDGSLVVGYLDDMATLEMMLEKAPADQKLGIMSLKLSAREKTVRLRQLLETIYNAKKQSSENEDEGDTLTGELSIKLKRKLEKASTPAERMQVINELEAMERDFIHEQLIDDEREPDNGSGSESSGVWCTICCKRSIQLSSRTNYIWL